MNQDKEMCEWLMDATNEWDWSHYCYLILEAIKA